MSKLTVLHLRDGMKTDITEIVSQVAWQGSGDQLSRRLDITTVNSLSISPGDWLVLQDEAGELFRGIVFTTFRTTEDTITPYAFDPLIYLDKSKDDYKFERTTDKKVIETLCSRFNIPVGSIEGSKTIKKLLLREKGLAEIIKELDTEYNLFLREGKLYREKKGKQVLQWVLDGNLIIKATAKESIEEMKNSVKVIEGGKITVIKDDTLIKKYGLLQEVIEAEPGQGVTTAKDMLKELGRVFKEMDIECIGFNECITGTYVEIEEKKTGLTGLFEITSDTHNYEGAVHRMTLTLKEVS
ncbi:MAG: hypothetical protein APF77_17770 [Clostridia bacterium BRH_c25]|nr:MAG: hypothetical protein APF77_17770 [Clostridia bacterium BRH_c25]